MPAIDSLIDGLRGEGEVVRRAAFTLDREKARDKLRQFQLADPRGYVLELIQAAVLKGATRIDLTLDADDLILRYDGRPFTREDGEELYGAMFTRGATVDLRARRQLALGLNAALALNPSFVRLVSGALAMELRPDADDQVSAREPAAAGTEIHVHERFRPGVVARFFGRLGGQLAEANLVRQRCVHAALPITINGEEIQRERIPQVAIGVVPISSPGVRGSAGFVATGGGLRLIKDGVWISTRDLPGGHPQLLAVVEGDDLVKDVSQTKIVEDEALARVFALARAAERPAARALLDEAIPRSAVALSASGPLLRDALLRADSLEQALTDPHLGEVAQVPLWQDARAEATMLSLAEISAQRERFGNVAWASRAFATLKGGRAVVLLPQGTSRDAFLAFFGDACRDHTQTLARLEKRKQHEARWRARRMEAVLPADALGVRYHARLPLEGESVSGELGIVSLSDADSRLFLFKDGCLLVERRVRLPVGGLEVALQAPLTPNAYFNDARRDEALATALLAVARALPRLLEVWAERMWTGAHGAALLAAARRYLHGYLAWASGPRAGAAFLTGYGFAERNAVRLAREADEAGAWRPALAGGEEPSSSPLARLRWLRTTDGGWLSLGEVDEAVRRDGSVRYVLDDQPSGVAVPVAPPLHLSRDEHALLGRLLPVGGLTDYADEYQAAADEAAFLDRPAELPAVAVPGLAKVDIATEDGISGELALLESLGAEVRRPMARLTLRQRQRRLAEVELDLPYGFAVVELNDDHLRANREWTEVRHDERFKRVTEVVRDGVDRALAALAESYPRLGASARVDAGDALLGVLATLRPQRREGRAELPVPALAEVPLFACLGGGAVSLSAVLAEVEANESVQVLSQKLDEPPAPGELVLVLGELEQRVLRRWVGGRAMVDAAPVFAERRRQRALEKLPVLDTLELPEHEVLVSTPIGDGEMRGTVGLTRRYPEVVAIVRLTLAKAGRRLAVVERPAPLHLVARVDDPSLPTDEEGQLDGSFGLERAEAAAVGAIGALVERLCDGWDAQSPAERAVAWRHLLDFFAWRSSIRRGAVRGVEEAYERAVRLAGFAGVTGGLHALAEVLEVAQRDGAVHYLRHALAGEPLDPTTVVLLLRRPEQACLTTLGLRLEDYEKRWLAEQDGRRRRARAEAVPTAAPADALVTVTAEHRGVQAMLWLPSTHATRHELVLGREGKVVERRATAGPLACAGVVHGDALPVSADWRQVGLDGEWVEWIDRLGARLFTELAREWGRGKLAPEAQRVAALYLARVVLELRRQIGDGGARLPVELGRLYRRLRVLPVLPLPSGKAVSLQRAQRERPIELRHLQLWDEPEEVSAPPRRTAPARARPKEEAGAKQTDAPRPAHPSVETATAPRPSSAPAAAAPAAPAVAAAPPEPNREQLFLAALRDELKWARTADDRINDLSLERLRVGDGRRRQVAALTDDGVVISRRNPLVAAALARFDDDPPVLLFVASAVYSLMNRESEAITDEDERVFHRGLIENLGPRPT